MRVRIATCKIKRLSEWLRSGESGTALLETLVALALLGFIAVAFLSGLNTTSKASIIADERANVIITPNINIIIKNIFAIVTARVLRKATDPRRSVAVMVNHIPGPEIKNPPPVPLTLKAPRSVAVRMSF